MDVVLNRKEERMSVVELSISKKEEAQNHTDYVGDTLREETLQFTKDFKMSWLNLGRHLYSIHRDKLYHAWDFNTFEDYTEKELGIKKSLCLKLLKAYLFLEEDEPSYLEKGFVENHQPINVPGYEGIDLLRTAKSKKELGREDYAQFRSDIFDKGRDVGAVRKELGALMKERKIVDPDEERDQRNAAAIRKLIASLRSFEKDMEVLKLLPDEVVSGAKDLISRLETELG